MTKKRKPSPVQDKLDAIGIDVICERISDCETLRSISESFGVSKGSLITWLSTYPDQYARAREAQADVMASDIIGLADKCRFGEIKTEKANGDVEIKTADMVERARLQIEARKWLAGKMSPKKYGDKIQTEVTGEGGGPLALQLTNSDAKL